MNVIDKAQKDIAIERLRDGSAAHDIFGDKIYRLSYVTILLDAGHKHVLTGGLITSVDKYGGIDILCFAKNPPSVLSYYDPSTIKEEPSVLYYADPDHCVAAGLVDISSPKLYRRLLELYYKRIKTVERRINKERARLASMGVTIAAK